MAHFYSKESSNRIALSQFLKNLKIGKFHPDLSGLSSLQKSKNQEYFALFYRLKPCSLWFSSESMMIQPSRRLRWSGKLCFPGMQQADLTELYLL